MVGKYVKINGCKLPINASDMAFMQRLSTASDTHQAAIATAEVNFPGDNPQAQYKRIDACVTSVCSFFDDLYGAGTADRIFHRTNEAVVYMNALRKFSVGVEAAVEAFSRRYAHTGTLKFNTALKRR